MLKVYNYFPTIQGEGRSIGKGVYLLRLYGCNYTCKWCDISGVSQCRVEYEKIDLYTNITNLSKLQRHIDDTLKKYKIDTLLITGGEPTLYFTPDNQYIFNLIANNFKIIEIETNGSNPSNYFSYLSPHEYFNTFKGQIRFNVSPKLNFDAYAKYPYIQTIDDLIEFYKPNIDKLVTYYNITSYSGVTFKFVYKPEYENNILYFIEKLNIPKKSIMILPYTPVEHFNKDELEFYRLFKESRLQTVEFCLKHGLRYTPREHIELYFLNKNEHMDAVKSE